jgi:hypothetical protein
MAKGSTSIWIELTEWKTFQHNSAILGASANARIDEFIKKSNAEFNGQEYKPEENFEVLKDERLKLKKRERDLFKLLLNPLHSGRTTYEFLCDFAGINTRMERDIIEKAYTKMLQYRVVDSDPFGSSDLENFIDYIETVMRRREIEAKIKSHRLQNFASSNDA